MTSNRATFNYIFAVACCLIIILAPLSVHAQGIGGSIKNGVQKGAGTVQKGVEGAADATKKGVEATGRGVKKAVTGDDDNNTNNERMKDSDTNSGYQNESSNMEKAPGAKAAKKNLPKTAGELPLLALVGTLSLAGAALARRQRSEKKS